ncbi:hypothetical protein BH23ACT9_BH23ACT9_36470 [soil metagenome]
MDRSRQHRRNQDGATAAPHRPAVSAATSRDGERGAAALEMALVLPVLMALVFGIISYGTMLSFRQSISQAAAEGARAAAVAPAGLPDAGPAGTDNRDGRARAAMGAALANGTSCDSAGMTCTVVIDRTTTPAVARVSVAYDWAGSPLLPTFPLVPMPATLAFEAVAEVS